MVMPENKKEEKYENPHYKTKYKKYKKDGAAVWGGVPGGDDAGRGSDGGGVICAAYCNGVEYGCAD